MEEPKSEIRDLLVELGHENAVVLDPVELDTAITGVTDDGRVVYDYEKLVAAFMSANNWTEDEATEWIDYNTIRALPYMGPFAPIIVYPIEQYL